VSHVDTAGRDVFDPIECDSDTLAGSHHRLAEEVVGPEVREGTAVATDGSPYAAEDEGVGHDAPSALGNPKCMFTV
jgi:hypothetical protein